MDLQRLGRMTSDELRRRLETVHHEEVNKKMTKVELMSRLVELEGETLLAPVFRKTGTPLQQMITQINQASRRKVTLQELAQQTFGISVTGNETISILKVKCVLEAARITKASAEDFMGFGKHAAKTYAEAAQDEGYASWAKQMAKEGEVDPRMARWVKWLEESEPRTKEMSLAKKLEKKYHEEKTSGAASSGASQEKLTEMIEKLTVKVSELSKEVASVKEGQASCPADPVRKIKKTDGAQS